MGSKTPHKLMRGHHGYIITTIKLSAVSFSRLSCFTFLLFNKSRTQKGEMNKDIHRLGIEAITYG